MSHNNAIHQTIRVVTALASATAAPIPPSLIAAIAERSSASPAVRPRTGLRFAGDVCVLRTMQTDKKENTIDDQKVITL